MVGAVTGITAAGIAAAGAVASVGVGAYSAYESSKAAGQANDIANSQLGLEQNLFGQQQQYRDQLSALLKDPSSVTKLPSYKFFKDQGTESVARQSASNPSGAGSVALDEFGQNYASSAYSQQAQLLAGLSGLTQNPASYGQTAVGANSNAISGSGQSFQQIQQLLAQGGSALKMFGPQAGYSTAGTPGAGPSYSNIYPGYTVTTPGGPNG